MTTIIPFASDAAWQRIARAAGKTLADQSQTAKNATSKALVGVDWECNDLADKFARSDGIIDTIQTIALIGPRGRWSPNANEPTVELFGVSARLHLGDLEPLRSWVRRVRTVPECCPFHKSGGHLLDRHGLDPAAKVYGSDENYLPRLIITGYPDTAHDRALTSAMITAELTGLFPKPPPAESQISRSEATSEGRITVLQYASRAAHDARAIEDALRLISPH